MFQLASLSDSVKVEPNALGKDFQQAITDELNTKYSNKIVHDLGLCICLYDLAHFEDPIVFPGEGAIFTRVEFRLMIFRPFIGEVLQGKVQSCDEDGIRISVGFFDDIFVPNTCLKSDCRFDPAERVWIWEYDSNELFIDLEEPIRVRVMAERFIEVAPVEKDSASMMTSTTDSNSMVPVKELSKQVPAYVITASIVEDGLGLLSWWQEAIPVEE